MLMRISGAFEDECLTHKHILQSITNNRRLITKPLINIIRYNLYHTIYQNWAAFKTEKIKSVFYYTGGLRPPKIKRKLVSYKLYVFYHFPNLFKNWPIFSIFFFGLFFTKLRKKVLKSPLFKVIHPMPFLPSFPYFGQKKGTKNFQKWIFLYMGSTW